MTSKNALRAELAEAEEQNARAGERLAERTADLTAYRRKVDDLRKRLANQAESIEDYQTAEGTLVVEIADLKRQLADRNVEPVTLAAGAICAYCERAVFGPVEVMRAHIESCEKHPLFREKQAVRDAQQCTRDWVAKAAAQARRAKVFEDLLKEMTTRRDECHAAAVHAEDQLESAKREITAWKASNASWRKLYYDQIGSRPEGYVHFCEPCTRLHLWPFGR
jgi:DNA repair exonuclease SbcCD ATPase subunit